MKYLHLRPINFVAMIKLSFTDRELNESNTGKLFNNSKSHFIKTSGAVEDQTIITGSTKFGYKL